MPAPLPPPIVSGPPAAAMAQAPAAEPVIEEPAYLLDSGDKLRVVVFGQEGLSNSYSVDAAGMITMPLIGPVPARERTTILFANQLEQVTLDIYTVEGRLAAHLEKPAGLGSVTWDLKDGAGRPVAPGIYVAKVRGRSDSGSHKIVVLR